MTRGQKCDNCQKKFDNNEGIYAIKFYHGEKSTDLFSCPVCYQSKKEEFLENYSVISFISFPNGANSKEIKIGYIDCYAGKKDQNGQILKQKDCQHCQPWKFQPWKNSLKKTCDNCGKDISKQEIIYSSKSSGEEEEFFCSLEHMDKYSKSEKNPKNNSENKRMPTEMKVFLGILVVILVFIIGIALGKITQKNKNNKK